MCLPVSAPLSIVASTNWHCCVWKPAQNASRTLSTFAFSLSTAIPWATWESTSPGQSRMSPITVPAASAAATRLKALEIAHGVHRRPIHARLEVQVVAEAVAGAADVADHLALAHRRAVRGGEARLVGVAGGQAAGVLDAGVVAVAADPAHEDHAAPVRGVDRRATRHRDVDPGVQPPPAHPESRDDRAVHGPAELPAALLERAARVALDGRLHARLLALERHEVALQLHAAVVHLSERAALVRARRGELVARADELVLDRCDLVALLEDALRCELLLLLKPGELEGLVLRLVAEAAHAVGDLASLVRDAVEELGALEQVAEAVGLEDHRERVGRVGLVDLHEAGGENAARRGEVAAEPLVPVARLLQPVAD